VAERKETRGPWVKKMKKTQVGVVFSAQTKKRTKGRGEEGEKKGEKREKPKRKKKQGIVRRVTAGL